MADNKHLTWLVQSRSANQNASLRLLKIIRKHEAQLKSGTTENGKSAVIAQILVSTTFSLWRAAFLADIKPTDGFDHATSFLEKLVIDNAINYAQDRAARAWTWAYYMSTAYAHLHELKNFWPDFDPAEDNTLGPNDHWATAHRALDDAVDRLDRDLTGRKKKRRKRRA